MADFNLAAASKRISELSMFKGTPVTVQPLFNVTGREKCFLVKPLHTQTSFKVRFSTKSDPLSCATEHEALNILKDAGIAPIPNIYEFSRQEPACLATSYYEGETLERNLAWIPNAAMIERFIHDMVLTFHSLRGKYYGRLAGQRYSTWPSFLLDRLSRHIWAVRKAGAISDSDMQVATALATLLDRELEQAPAAFIHFDVKPANILFSTRTNQTMLLDFELARFGDPDFEWVKLHGLAQRWPEYKREIAEPLLRTIGYFEIDPLTTRGAKLLLYSLYQTCSFLAFEWMHELPIPSYRTEELQAELKSARIFV